MRRRRLAAGPDLGAPGERVLQERAGGCARRRAVCLAASLLVALTLACAKPETPVRIILISVDTLRADHLGCYGYDRETTPRLDRLAREGAYFRSAVSTSSWTLPAHMSMLTGLMPRAHGMISARNSLDPARHLVQELLREAGFRTAGFVSGPYVDERYGYARGFETYRNFWGGEDEVLEQEELDFPGTTAEKGLRREAVRSSHYDQTGPEVVAAATDWLERHAAEPFFLFVHLWEPHYEFLPPAPFDTLFVAEGYEPSADMKGFIRNRRVHAGMNEADLAYVISQYDGEIAYTDLLIGRILDHLGKLGIADETLVIVTSDHGEEFFEHGRKGHQKTLYDEVVLVPLIVKGPQVKPAPGGIDAQVSLIDLAPTLLAAGGLNPPPEMTGRNLFPLLSGQEPRSAAAAEPPPSEPKALSELRRKDGGPEGEPCVLFAARSPDWKVILGCLDPVEIYDLTRDPAETHRLSPERREDAASTLRQGERLNESVERAAAALPRRGAEKVTIDDALRERLRALGYVD